MSVYDFNQVSNSHEMATIQPVRQVSSNGVQARYQVDNDYMANRAYSSAHHMDMSVQLTRPTSKTAMLVRQRRGMLEQLSCFLCKGYLIDATTIDECMDSFCKSCIVIYLRSHSNCPKCGTIIQRTNPLGAIRSDKVLQDIVFKLVPGLYDDEMKRRRDYYRGRYGASSSDDSDEEGSSGSFVPAGHNGNLTSEQYGVVSHPKPFYRPTDSIDISIEPQTRSENSTIYYDNKRQSIVTCFTGSQQQQNHPYRPSAGSIFSSVDSQQFKTYLRCPAKLTALQLKKFIAAKFNVCKEDTIHLLYLNESLRDEYSLIDIAYIYDWRGIEHMRLFYIIERDINKSSDPLDYQSPESHGRKNKNNSNTGTSTQTVKRVCIDPQPKFYEEPKTCSNSNGPSISSRSMRTRNDTAAMSNLPKIVPGQISKAPILRSYVSGPRETPSSHKVTPDRECSSDRAGKGIQHLPGPSSLNHSVTDAIKELSRMRQDGPRAETRYSRSQLPTNTNTSTGPVAKLNFTLNPPIEHQTLTHRAMTDQGKIKTDANSNHIGEIVNDRNSVRHLVPYVAQGYSTLSTIAGPSQSSLVTLASFSAAKSNNGTAMSTKSSTAISHSYRNMIGTSASVQKPEIKSNIRTPNQSPQLAFSYVTERGITIVRRLNNTDSESGTTTRSVSSCSAGQQGLQRNSTTCPPSLPEPSHNHSNSASVGSQHNHTRSAHNSVGPHVSPNSSQQSGASLSSHQASYSPSNALPSQVRHHPKVKPVYKTFVDPTKLKSPNFKKLGFTARH